MAGVTWVDFTTAALKIGRAEVLYGNAWGTGITDLFDTLTHIGVTEEPIQPEYNEEYNDLMLPEHTGPAIIERDLTGINVVLNFNVIAASQATFDVLSPVGARGGGFQLHQSVSEKTIVLVPTAAVRESNVLATLDYTSAAGFSVGGDAATAAQAALLDLSFFIWRCHFQYGAPRYSIEGGGKAIIPVTVQAMQDFNRPQGQQIITIGDPADVGIDIEPSTS